jgi:carbon storage regulator CsrA
MLVLTRKCGTEIVIDGRIRVAVLRVGTGQVRLGISTPATVPVFRQELVKKADPGQDGETATRAAGPEPRRLPTRAPTRS